MTINKIINFVLYFVAFQIVFGLLFGAFAYGDCVIYRNDYVQNLNESTYWSQYVYDQFGCYLAFGVPSPFFFIKPKITAFVLTNLVANILIFSLLILVLKKAYAKTKILVKSKEKIWKYIKSFIYNLFLIYIVFYLASIVLQLSLRIIGYYDESYAGGPIVYYSWEHVFPYLVYPLTISFYNLSTYLFFLPFQILIAVVLVSFLNRRDASTNKKERILYFVFFMLLTIILLNFTYYITHGVVDIHCFHNSSDCDG